MAGVAQAAAMARWLPCGLALLMLVVVSVAEGQRTYRVRQGDTLLGIARRFDVRLRDLKRANGLRGDLIRPGMRLRLPGAGSPAEATPPSRAKADPEARQRRADLGLGSARVAHHLLHHPPDPRWVKAAGEPEDAPTLANPVPGGVLLRGWGSGRRGYHKAVDLGAEPGTSIGAAAGGLVAYAGRGVRGYGNIVILVHPDASVTWYAHNRRNLVAAGQRVVRGEAIAQVGATGYARGAHVHLMLVRDGEHCDALPLLDPPPRPRPNAKPVEARAEPGGATPAIRCAPKRRRARRR
jgi:murein DD-endopeptidase MepM/ murein hydrolase activator NlpD